MKQLNNITALGVRRPVLIVVVNILIMLTGVAALFGVDVRELPDVDRPIVSVRANFIGASPETMDAEVTSVLEAAVARVAGVRSIASSSEENNMRMRVEFSSSVNINDAANDVREAVSRAQRQLPDDIERVLVIKADDDASSIIELSAFSDVLDKASLARRIEKEVAPELLSIDGVANVNIDGDQPRLLKVLLYPHKMAAYRLTVNDIITTLRDAKFDVPAGSYESQNQELIVRAFATISEPQRLENLAVRKNVRISDVAQVFYSQDKGESYSVLNGRMIIGLGIVRQSGANTIEISTAVKQKVEQINARARDFTLATTSDDAVYIIGALQEVLYTLIFAIGIVLVVIAIFLGQWRATLIPAVTMPVSIIGTLAAIWLFGFSINLLTLLALVLAAGLIVDDAIVVLENIQRLRSRGYEKMSAAVVGTRQVFFAVIATTITLVSVFLPIAFLPGQTGKLFQEFALVLSMAVVISSFVAVTLCPMLASRLSNISQSNTFFSAIRDMLNRFGRTLSAIYFRFLNVLLVNKIIAVALSILVALTGYYSFTALNQELLPREDRGAIRVFLTGPDGTSLNYADTQAQKVEAILRPYQQQGIITNIFSIIGRWDKNRAFVVGTLQDWHERDMSQQDLASEINKQLRDIPGAQIRIWHGNSLNIRGAGGGLRLAILGDNYDEIAIAADNLSKVMQENIEQIEDVRVQFDTSQAQLSFDIDREKAHDLNMPITRISETLRVMVDSFDVIDLNIDDQSVPISLGPANGVVNDASDLLNILIPNDDNKLIPISAIVNVKESGVAAELDRHAQRRAIEINIGLKPGAPLGDMVTRIRQVADDNLPVGMNIRFLGEAATLQESNNEVLMLFIMALLVVFLVLAAQFESIGSAVIVIFTVPFGLAAAVFALYITGMSINLYSQIGLVMLIGLMTKNAILLVEFMEQLRDEGAEIMQAIIEGVRIRLRPVMMTVCSTVFGALPLVLSDGPGAEARSAIGWVIFAGVGLSALFTLFLTPLGYAIFSPFVKTRSHAGKELEKQLKNDIK